MFDFMLEMYMNLRVEPPLNFLVVCKVVVMYLF